MENEIIKKINKYFESPTLEILDKEVKMTSYGNSFYTGVTLDYIKTYVLEDKYEFKDIVPIIKDLFINDKLRSLHCGKVEDVVFESPKYLSHWCFNKNDPESEYFGVNRLYNYLNNKLKNE